MDKMEKNWPIACRRVPPGHGAVFRYRKKTGQRPGDEPCTPFRFWWCSLCPAALYESWSVPFSVIMVIPLGLLGAALAATLRGLSNDVYFRVALLTTIGLSSKNAILIVEFAESAVDEGYSLSRAAIRAAQTRLRPIVMTSLAFIAGVLPLAIATGAGANSRVAIGTGIIGGTPDGDAAGGVLRPAVLCAGEASLYPPTSLLRSKLCFV